ncbi:hypothetical protein BST61_g1425 [Cercospora zeina]
MPSADAPASNNAWSADDEDLPTPDQIMALAREAFDARSRASKQEKQAVLQKLSTRLREMPKNTRNRSGLIRGLRLAVRKSDPLRSVSNAIQGSPPPTQDAAGARTAAANAASTASEAAGVDLAYVEAHMSWPTDEDYPRAPDAFRQALKARDARFLSTFITHLASRHTPPIAVETRTKQRVVGSLSHGWTMSVHFHPNASFEQLAVGLGNAQLDAHRAAWLALVSKLHTAGTLAKIVPEAPAEVETVMPRPEQYPGAPARLFDAAQIDQAMQQAFKSKGLNVRVNAQFTTPQPLVYQFTLRLDIPGIADATTTGHGALQQLFPPPRPSRRASPDDGSDSQIYIRDENETDIELVEAVDKQVMQQEKDAKLDIYNYAAKYGLIPHFSTKSVRLAARRTRKSKGKQSRVVQATIKLPEQGIDIVIRGRDLRTAETAAAVAFKRQAEEKQLSADDQAKAVLPGYELLNTETAWEFLEHFRSSNRGMSFEVETEVIAGLHHTRILFDGEVLSEPGIMPAKRDSEQVAHLLAAISISNASPNVLSRWAARRSAGGSRRSLRPFDVPVETKVLDLMRDTLISARKAGLPDQRESLGAEEISRDTSRSQRRFMTIPARDLASATLKERLDRFRQDPRLETLRATKAGLPMSTFTDQVVGLVNHNVYSIVIGATGSGKTTQVPQILLERATEGGRGGYCDVICTQPRRIAATSVAQRVAAERDEAIGRSVGYHVRGDVRLPQPGGSITYCTTGLLLEQLKHNAEDILDNVSHLVIDEVHERDIFVDFLLAILKKAVAARLQAGKKVPHIVLMSATLDEKLFSEYLPNVHDGKLVPCPSLSVPGRTFPVAEKYLEQVVKEISASHAKEFNALLCEDKGVSKDYLDAELKFAQDAAVEAPVIDWKRKYTGDNDTDAQDAAAQKHGALVPVHLLTAVLAHICEQNSAGAVLAFLPGLQEITKTQELLMQRPIFGVDFGDSSKFTILPLHSTVPPDQQKLIFEPSPAGCRKIILATNIAETSVTVPDVKFVVDLGKLREKQYDQTKRISALETVWESNSNARQRAGRAGRVSDGNYYALYSQRRRETMPASGLPELLRSDLQETCLAIKAQGFRDPVSDFLADAIEPPASEAVEVAVENLKGIEALTEDEQLTSLGRVLSRLPVHPTLGNMVLLGIIFRCLDPIIIGSCLGSDRSLFIDPPAVRAEARKRQEQYRQGNSDHLTFINAFKRLRTLVREEGPQRARHYAQENYLHMGAFRTTEQTTLQVVEALHAAGLLTSRVEGSNYQLGGQALNVNSANTALVKSLVLAGTYPNLAIRRGQTRAPIHKTMTEDKVMIHPSSTNAGRRDAIPENDQLFAFNSLSRSLAGDTLYMRDTTPVTPLMAILFGGRLTTKTYHTLTMDQWLPFSIKALNSEFAVRLMLEFRKAKDRMLFGAYRDLSALDRESRGLLEDPAREIFADGVVAVLKRAGDGVKMNDGEKKDEHRDLFKKYDTRSRGEKRNDGEQPKAGRGRRFEGKSDDVRNELLS